MNTQSKILSTVLVGVATGLTIGVLVSNRNKNKTRGRISLNGHKNLVAANKPDDWSDLNDSLGG